MESTESMRAITIARPGGPEVLALTEMARPALRPNEVLIRVAAAGVNYPDLLQRAGRYDPPPGASPLLGLEVSGVVVACGAAATGPAVGENVVALTNGGGYAEYVAVPAGQVLPLPAGPSLVAGAALPETFFTIAQTLVMRAGIEPGMSVLVHGAAGGLGGAAVQITKALGAHAIAVVSNPEKAEYARSLGAAATIDHTREDFVARTFEVTEGRGADRILALSGGDMLARNCAAAARFGVIAQLATLGEANAQAPLGVMLEKMLTLFAMRLRPQTEATKATIAETLRQLVWPAFADRTISGPRVETLPLAEAGAAHRTLAERGHFGKLVLVTDFGATTG